MYYILEEKLGKQFIKTEEGSMEIPLDKKLTCYADRFNFVCSAFTGLIKKLVTSSDGSTYKISTICAKRADYQRCYSGEQDKYMHAFYIVKYDKSVRENAKKNLIPKSNDDTPEKNPELIAIIMLGAGYQKIDMNDVDEYLRHEHIQFLNSNEIVYRVPNAYNLYPSDGLKRGYIVCDPELAFTVRYINDNFCQTGASCSSHIYEMLCNETSIGSKDPLRTICYTSYMYILLNCRNRKFIRQIIFDINNGLLPGWSIDCNCRSKFALRCTVEGAIELSNQSRYHDDKFVTSCIALSDPKSYNQYVSLRNSKINILDRYLEYRNVNRIWE